MNQKTNRRYVTLGIFVATFLAAIEGTIVSTAMPTIVSELGGLQLISWVVSMYLLTSTVTTPIYGKMADLYGRKVVMAVSTLLFLAGSMLSGTAHTMDQLIWFRAFQGLGAGGILTLTFTIIADIYPYEQRGKIQGLISGVWGIAGIFGPLTGGFLVDYVSWRWIFYMNAPFGIIALVLIWLFLKEDIERKKRHIDYSGAVTFTISTTALLYALLTGGTVHPWSSPIILGLILLALVLFGVFLNIQTKSPEPMLPLKLFKIRLLTVCYLGGFALSVVLIGITFYLPVWIQGIYGQGATGSGLTLIPMSIGWPIGANLSGRMTVKTGFRPTSLFGGLALILGTGCLALLTAESAQWVLYLIMFIVGLGFGFVITSTTLAVQSAVDWTLRGTAMGTNTFVRALGQTIGVAVLGTIFNQSLAGHTKGLGLDLNKILNPEGSKNMPPELLRTMRESLGASLHMIFLVLAVVAVVAFFIMTRLPKEKKPQEQTTS